MSASSSGRKRATSRSRGAPGKPGGAPVFAIVVGVLVALFALAVVLTRSDQPEESDGSAAQETAPISIAGPALPPYDPEADDAAVGRPLPEVTGKNFEGDRVALSPDDGRPKVLIFLSHSCPHCQAEVPLLQSWLEDEGAPEGVDLYSVVTNTTSELPNYPPSDWLDREGWTVPVVLDDQRFSAQRAFGLTAFPFWVFVDSTGEIAGRATGELPIKTVESVIGRLGEGGG